MTDYTGIFSGTRYDYSINVPPVGILTFHGAGLPVDVAKEFIHNKTGEPRESINVTLRFEPIPGVGL